MCRATKFMIEEIKKYVKFFRAKKFRIRTMFLRLRKLLKFNGWSDIVLLESIVVSLIELGEKYSKNEIYAAFKLVDRDDYCLSDKRGILKNLLINTNNKSTFN